MALTDRAYIRELLLRHGFAFSKALGQNFLINPSVCPRMASESGAGPGVGVLEIGPGVGVLTAELAQRAERVVCIELDARLLPILSETLTGVENVEVLCGDAMKADLAQIITSRFAGLDAIVCANLPYYITTPILMRLLEERLPVKSITVMVQKEAAQRLCAAPGERACGAISAAIHYYCEPRQLFSVSAGSFLPAPKVDSAVIRLDILPEPPVRPKDERLMFEVVRGVFSQRRKRAVNALSSAMGLNKAVLDELFASGGIDPDARAERLTLSQLAAISDGIALLKSER